MENSGKSALGLDPNVAAGLAYLHPICGIGLIMSIIILVTDKSNKLARFHAFQSLLLLGAWIAGYIAVTVINILIAVVAGALDMPALSFLAVIVLAVFVLGMAAALIIGCVKAFMGQMFKLPVIGNMADNWSN